MERALRRRRLIRGGYRHGTKKKPIKKVLVRVVFVIVCATVLTSLAVLLGSYLNGRAKTAESLLATSETQEPTTEKNEFYPDGIPSDSDAASTKVCAAHIDVVGVSSDEVKASILGLGSVYNAVSVNLVTENGSLVYLSNALMDYVRLDPEYVDRTQPGESPDDTEEGDTTEPSEVKRDALAAILTAIDTADSLGLRKSAVFSASPEVLLKNEKSYSRSTTDGILLGEVCSFGFDEVIITSLVSEDDEITPELLKTIISYLAILREYSSDLDIGIMLPASVYLVPQSASFIKTLSEYADFLAIAISTDAEEPESAYSAVFDNCHSLKGNFSVYNIRGVITSADAEIAPAVFAALRDLSASSVQFSVYVESPNYEPEISSGETEQPRTELPSNENAVSKEDYLYNEDTTATGS